MTEDEQAEVGPQIEAELGEALGKIIGKHETCMVLKWTALVETMDEKGERGLWTLTSPDVKAWDTVGMLQHALHLQQSQTVWLAGDDDDEDDD